MEELPKECIERLNDGEITTEQAKELNNRFFDKYITESTNFNITEEDLNTLLKIDGMIAKAFVSIVVIILNSSE